MNNYNDFLNLFEKNKQNQNQLIIEINKKKRKKSSKNENEMIISFKPLIKDKIKDSKISCNFPIPFEKEFCDQCYVQFYDIQIEAIRWMYWIEQSKINDKKNVGGILGDVMGLGKTMDALGITCYDYFSSGLLLYDKIPKLPTLIITTLTLLQQWKNELIEKFKYPEKYILLYHGSKRYESYDNMNEKGLTPLIVISNYETIQKDYEKNNSIIFKIFWMRILLDEAHIARNSKTNTFHALKKLNGNAKWCITGTPIVNYPDDIRKLSQICTPSFPLVYGSSLIETKWKKLFLLRRTKEMLPLPSINQEDIWLELTENEKNNYSKLELWAHEVYDELVLTHTLNQKYQKILLVLVRLRQACDHILLQEGYEYTSKLLNFVKDEYKIKDIFKKKKEISFIQSDDCTEIESYNKIEIENINEPNLKYSKEININTFEYSSKLIFIEKFIKNIIEQDLTSKIVIFTQFVTMLDLIEITLIKCNLKILRFDGRIQKSCIRNNIIDLFTFNSEYRIILTSLKAGGVGLNLVAANYLILVDPWWNSSVEYQAFDRVHRIGQKNPVKIYRLLIKGSIEEEVLKIQKKKNNHENSFYNMYSEKILSIKDIHCVFNTMRVRQLKENKQT